MKKKSTGFLKLIIAYKTLVGIAELIASVIFFAFLDRDLEKVFTRLALSLNLDVDNYFINGALKQAGMIHSSTVSGIIGVIFIFGALNLIEAWGLHLKQRWAEWLTVIGTSLLIPFEVYEIVRHVSVLKILILIINTAIVYYLAKHKELFKGYRKREQAATHGAKHIQ